jgi:two-component system sensor histidine kinase/response regulator
MPKRILTLAPELLVQLINCAGTGIVLTDVTLPDNPIIFANEAFYAMTQLSPEEIIGKNCRFLQASDTKQTAIDTMRDAISRGEKCQVVLRNYRKDGTMFWNELNLAPYFDESHKLTHYIGIQNDITARVEQAQQKAMFNNGILHDIKGAMFGQSLVVEFLANQNRNKSASSRESEAHQHLLKSLQSTLHLITESLLHYKLDNDMVKPRLESFSAHDLALEVMNAVALAAKQKNVEIHLSEPGGKREISGDRGMVFRALKNLVDNALTYSPTDANIWILSTQTDTANILAVLDEGCGLSQELQDALRHDVSEISTPFTNTQSTGLGLMTCAQIMRMHHGSLTLLKSSPAGTDLALVFPKA